MNARLDFLNIFGAIILFRTLLTAAYHYTGTQIFNTANDALSIALIAFSLVYAVVLSPIPISYVYFATVAAAGFVGTLFVNSGAVSPDVAIKYVSLYCFYAAGRAAGQGPDIKPGYLVALAVLPLLFLAFGPSKVIDMRDSAHLNIPPFGFLPNANTATLYYSAIIFALASRLGYFAVPVQFINAISFARNGAILATAMSFVIVDAKRIYRNIHLYIPGVLIVFIAAWILGALDRVLLSMSIVFHGLNTYGVSGIAAMPYGDLAYLFQSTDLSAFFRLKHWLEIWEAFTSGGLPTLLFGYGPGQSQFKTTLPLVPHNDYLRILAEFGLINFGLFVALVVHAARGAQGPARFMFLVFAFYAFTENLLDNATSMALFFAYAGVYRARAGRPARVATPAAAILERRQLPWLRG